MKCVYSLIFGVLMACFTIEAKAVDKIDISKKNKETVELPYVLHDTFTIAISDAMLEQPNFNHTIHPREWLLFYKYPQYFTWFSHRNWTYHIYQDRKGKWHNDIGEDVSIYEFLKEYSGSPSDILRLVPKVDDIAITGYDIKHNKTKTKYAHHTDDIYVIPYVKYEQFIEAINSNAREYSDTQELALLYLETATFDMTDGITYQARKNFLCQETNEKGCLKARDKCFEFADNIKKYKRPVGFDPKKVSTIIKSNVCHLFSTQDYRAKVEWNDKYLLPLTSIGGDTERWTSKVRTESFSVDEPGQPMDYYKNFEPDKMIRWIMKDKNERN